MSATDSENQPDLYDVDEMKSGVRAIGALLAMVVISFAIGFGSGVVYMQPAKVVESEPNFEKALSDSQDRIEIFPERAQEEIAKLKAIVKRQNDALLAIPVTAPDSARYQIREWVGKAYATIEKIEKMNQDYPISQPRAHVRLGEMGAGMGPKKQLPNNDSDRAVSDDSL